MSNELGGGNAQGALLALRVMVVISILEGTAVGLVTILVRNVWGKLYSNDDEVIKYVAKMMPLLALSDFLDGFQCVLSGSNSAQQPNPVIMYMIIKLLINTYLSIKCVWSNVIIINFG